MLSIVWKNGSENAKIVSADSTMNETALRHASNAAMWVTSPA